jgi:hypothetical protein
MHNHKKTFKFQNILNNLNKGCFVKCLPLPGAWTGFWHIIYLVGGNVPSNQLSQCQTQRPSLQVNAEAYILDGLNHLEACLA